MGSFSGGFSACFECKVAGVWPHVEGARDGVNDCEPN